MRLTYRSTLLAKDKKFDMFDEAKSSTAYLQYHHMLSCVSIAVALEQGKNVHTFEPYPSAIM